LEYGMLLKRWLARLKGLEAQALLVWLALASALWIFFTLGAEIGEGDTGAFDRHLITLLRTSGNSGEPIGPAWFKDSMRDVTALGGFTFLMLMTVVVVLGLLFHRKRREAIILAATALSAQTSIEILKFLYDRPRPALLMPQIHAFTKSFPSGHTTESTAIFLTVATVIASLETKHHTKILAFTVAAFAMIAVGFSRVYLGMHWPTDVLGGWMLGTAWALAAWSVLRRTKGN
jgi:undecaprenyl-diphosphatase